MTLPTITANTRVLLIMTAQVVLSVLFIGGYFYMLYLFMMGHVLVPDSFKDMFLTLIGVLTAGVGTVLSFWFQRQRERTQETPPP